jgi:tetratricopeptide (TPR) repeat protein
MDHAVGKQQNRPAKSQSPPARPGFPGIGDELGLATLRRRSTALGCGPDRPRIGVSSFTASDSERNENLAFALAQEITAALGCLRCFDVIAAISPNSEAPTFLVREHRLSCMGLDYLVDLTLSEIGQDIEIKVRLLDLRGNTQPIWSTRLDLTDPGMHQIGEYVATHVVGRVGPVIPLVEGVSKRRSGYAATGFLRRALPLMFSIERVKFRQAGQLIKFALEIDPDDAEITAWAARWQYFNINMGYAQHSREEVAKVGDFARRSVKSNPDHAEGLGLYGHYCSFTEKRFDAALDYFDRSLRINPSLAFIWGMSALTYSYIGEPTMALERLERYRELAPFDTFIGHFELVYTIAYLFNQDYERAAIMGRRAVAASPGFVNAYKPLIAALGHLGRREEAKRYADALLKLEPDFTVASFAQVYPIKKTSDRTRYMEGLRAAGLPER